MPQDTNQNPIDPTVQDPNAGMESTLEHMLMNHDAHAEDTKAILEHQLQKTDDIDKTLEHVATLQSDTVDQLKEVVKASTSLIEALKPQEMQDGATFIVKGLKGDKGDTGNNGKTPTTDELVTLITPLIPKPIKGDDGYTPVKGIDYDDGEDGYTPIKGKDYFDGKDAEPTNEDEIIKKIIKKIPKPKAGKDGSTDTGDEIIKKIKGILSYNDLEDVPDVNGIIRKSVASKDYNLYELKDVTITGAQTDGQALVWNVASQRWIPGTVGGGGGAVSSVFGRTGAVVAVSGDYNTSQVTENTNLYFTNARAIASTLTGYTSGAGTVSSTDSILQAIQKLNGNIGALVTGVSSFNTRTGAVTLTSGDVTTALGFTPVTTARVLTTNTPLTGGGDLSANRTLSINQAGTSTAGYLSSTDWNTFNNKLGSAITSLNGLTGATQTFATPGTSGTAPAWVSSGTAHTLNIPMASASGVTAGLISKTQYDLFAAGGVTFSTGLTKTGSVVTANISTGIGSSQVIYGGAVSGGSLTIQANAADGTGPIFLVGSDGVFINADTKLYFDANQDGFTWITSDFNGTYGTAANVFFGVAQNIKIGSGEDPTNSFAFLGINVDPEYPLHVQGNGNTSHTVARFSLRDTNNFDIVISDEGLAAGYPGAPGSIGTDGASLWQKWGGGDNDWGYIPYIDSNSIFYQNGGGGASHLYIASDDSAPLRVYDSAQNKGVYLDSGGVGGDGVVGLYGLSGDEQIAIFDQNNDWYVYGGGTAYFGNSGGIQFTPLSGTGTRVVLADSNGTLSASHLEAQFTTVQYAAPSSTTTITSNGSPQLVVNPSGTALVALTIAFPSSPGAGQLFSISTTTTITTITLSSSQAILGSISGGSITAATPAGWVYEGTLAQWVRRV